MPILAALSYDSSDGFEALRKFRIMGGTNVENA